MPIKLIRAIHAVQGVAKGGVLTIGNFDGVHLGHQALVNLTIQRAKEVGGPSVAVTFEPHAFEFFAGDHVRTPRLTRLREKYVALRRCGIDYVMVIPFNQRLAEMSASDFAIKMLVESLQPKHIVVGDDFHFGRQRQGNILLLEEIGVKHHFSVEALPTVTIDAERVSSTRVRKALADDDLNLAAKLLGRPYSMQGKVRRGDQRGRELGFPTANIFLHRKLTPVHGIYVVKMKGLDPDNPSRAWPGVANVGERPTFNGSQTLLEVHLLNFNLNIYGRDVEVVFCEKVRPEERYDTTQALIDQIAKDVAHAERYFSKNQ